MPADFHFLRPEWLWAMPGVLLITVALARRQLAPGSWQRVVSPQLVPYVLSRQQTGRLSYRWWLIALGGVLGVTALAGPAWNRIEQPVFRSEQAIVVALDLSRSMDAQDIAPSRLARARLKILDIIGQRQSGQTALVVFSSNAFTVTPLTSDTDTIASLVNSLSTDIMPSRGSHPAAAIRKGQQLLEQAGVGFGEVLLITDGGTSLQAEDAARELREAGYTLSILGVGTDDGAPIPRAGGGFVTDASGSMAVPKIDHGQLQSLASAGGGRYQVMRADNRDVEELLDGEVMAPADGGQSLATDQWQEEGPWLLIPLLPLAALAFRRGMLVAVLMFLVPLTEPAHAFEWNDLWLTPDQQAQRKLQQDQPAEAASLFEDSQWRAVANYRASEYASSAAGFAQNDDPASLYNLGNAMARMGEFDSAIDAYEQSLELRPGDQDALFNLELVRDMRDQQQQQEQQEGGQQSESESGGQSQDAQGESQSDQQSQQQEASESQEGEAGRDQQETSQEDLEAMQQALQQAAEEAEKQGEESTDEALSEADLAAMRRAQEQTQAMEQWLRRIDNDPGGLLRRKFRYQYQRQGLDQDGNSVWPDDSVEPW